MRDKIDSVTDSIDDISLKIEENIVVSTHLKMKIGEMKSKIEKLQHIQEKLTKKYNKVKQEKKEPDKKYFQLYKNVRNL